MRRKELIKSLSLTLACLDIVFRNTLTINCQKLTMQILLFKHSVATFVFGKSHTKIIDFSDYLIKYMPVG